MKPLTISTCLSYRSPCCWTHTHEQTHQTQSDPRTKIGSQQQFEAMNWLYSGGFSPSSPFSLYLFLSFTLSNHLWAATLQSSYNCLVQSFSLAITAGYESSQSNTDTAAIYMCLCVWMIQQEVCIYERGESTFERTRMRDSACWVMDCIFIAFSLSVPNLRSESVLNQLTGLHLSLYQLLHICLCELFYQLKPALVLWSSIIFACLSLPVLCTPDIQTPLSPL